MDRFADTAACRLLGCDRPIVLAGMGGVARSELVAAVTAAGGFGFLGMVRESPELITAEVERLHALGIERFGVNIIPAATPSDLLARQVEAIIALRVPAVTLFWDIDAPLLARLRAAGITVVYQVGTAAEARAAERAGAQLIIAQGREAGGHVRGDTPLQALLPAVCAAVELPVLAAGGLSTGADLVAALALGAEGVVLGTALMAAEESFAHRYHKQRLLAAVARDTLLTDIFHINWPHGARVRVLSSAVTVGGRGRDVEGARIPIGDEDGRPIYLFSTDSPLRCTTGDLESMALYAGTGVGNIVSIRSAASIIDDIMAEAGRLHEAAGAGARAMQASSPVCYAGEMGGDYMGELPPDALAAELGPLLGEVIAMLARRPPRDRAAPPFTRELLNLAPSLLGLASHAGRTVRPLADADPAPGAVEGRIGLLSTRVAEGALRHALVTLRAAVERLAGSGRQLVERRTEEA